MMIMIIINNNYDSNYVNYDNNNNDYDNNNHRKIKRERDERENF